MISSNRFQYSSIEELQHALSSFWDVGITQSEPGFLEGTLSLCSVGDCLVYGSRSNRSLVCTGQRSKGYWTITPITADCSSGYYRGQQLDAGDLLLLNPGGEVFQRLMPGHRQNAVSIPLPLAKRIIRAEYRMAPQELWQRWCMKSAPNVSRQLDQALRTVLAGRAASLASGTSLNVDFAAQVIALVQSGGPPKYAGLRPSFRRSVVSRAEELIRSRLYDPPSITELCEATHVSRRTLFYAFGELLGRSPGAHGKVLRLHAARRRINQLGRHPCVQHVASEFGFNHPGQFAMDYSRHFGELPSETRKRARSSLPKPPGRRTIDPPAPLP